MSERPTILITGVDGLIGSALESYLRSCGHEVIGTTRRSSKLNSNRIFLDLAAETIELRLPQQIDAAVLCAAVTGYANCENDPLSQRINVTNTVSLAKQLLDQGIFVVFISTNVVFSGKRPYPTEYDTKQPATAYGRQKAEAEDQILSLAENTPGQLAIVRLTKVVSAQTSPIEAWIDNLLAGKEIRPFLDLIICPISLAYVVKSLAQLLKTGEPGVRHCTGEADMSYADFAYQLAGHLKVSRDLVQPTTSTQAGVALLTKPAFSALGVGGQGGLFGATEPVGSVISNLGWPRPSAQGLERAYSSRK